MTDGVIRIMRSGESIGDLRSVLTAHRIAHLFLAEWPELAPLTVVGLGPPGYVDSQTW